MVRVNIWLQIIGGRMDLQMSLVSKLAAIVIYQGESERLPVNR